MKSSNKVLTSSARAGAEAALFRLPFSDRGDIIKELLEAKGIVVGSSTINNSILPTVAPFLEELEGLKPRNKVAAAFGSYGWGGGAVKTVEEKLKRAGMEVVADALTVKWVPDESELQKCFELGKEIAKKIAEIK